MGNKIKLAQPERPCEKRENVSILYPQAFSQSLQI